MARLLTRRGNQGEGMEHRFLAAVANCACRGRGWCEREWRDGVAREIERKGPPATAWRVRALTLDASDELRNGNRAVAIQVEELLLVVGRGGGVGWILACGNGSGSGVRCGGLKKTM